MAISKNNPLTKGASGMIGNTVVFRSWNGKTYMYNRPSKPKKESRLQKENRTKFSRAVAFSRQMMGIPEKKAEYAAIAKRENLPNAYTAAVTEYMRKPEIVEVDPFSREKEIKVVARKKGFELQEVEVILIGENGEVIEEGKAIKGLGDDWSFSTVKAFKPETMQLVVKARDRLNYEVIKKI
jgi:hypothetical protein